ncbi:AAA family ATPase [Paenibacillus sp. GCM10012307]|uniref:Nuclease SbcCD subunit C n=1 Tax=Paenibacillus roseus TaxID=2798579 RepID=A0A934J201_9BACL|nr:AAA family ATPase [Paenibacillus roseus]MBJ6361829.1 AAA family ATPase [Paenibacillus roseus]
MYLTEVKIKNFRGYGENNASEDKCYVYSALDSQLVVFHGFNGFGKTSFYEAIEWCLTDNVYRLNKFYDGDTYLANELKKSHYLKFYHPLDGARRNREIYVELLFDNGLSIVRTSNSPILKTSKNDKGYLSKVLMGYNGQLVHVSNEEVLNQFIKETEEKDTFFNTHMLGQESIGDFLRNNSPSERREIFMQLLQEEKLTSTIQLLGKLKGPNNKVSNKLKQLGTDLTLYNNTKAGITQSFVKLGFENELQYLDTIRVTLEPVLELIKGDILSEELKLSLLSNKEINLNNIAEVFENILIVHQNVSNQQTLLNTEMEELTRRHERVKKLGLLHKAEEMMKLSQHAQLLKTSNVVEIRQEISSIVESGNVIRQKIENISNKKNELIKYNELFLSNTNNLDFANKAVNDIFWTKYSNDRNELSKFNKEFLDLLRLQGDEYDLIKTSSELEISEWKSKEALFQKERKVLLQELESCSNTKRELSDLNTEYQNLLNVVKEYIATNEADIRECPVCLNNNFSDDRFRELFVHWNVDTSTASKLTSIIDLTFAKGNNQIDIISNKETDILAKLKELDDNFVKDILNALKLEVQSARNTFFIQYTFILNNLNSDNLALNEQEREKNNRKNALEHSISQVNESIKVLFNDLGNEEQINKDDLEKYIVDCREWIQKNHIEMGLLHQPNLSDIQSEIKLVKTQDSGNNQEDDNLLVSIPINKKNKEFTEHLFKLLNEILKYNIPTEFSKSLGEFSELDKKIEKTDNHIKALDIAKERIDEQYDKLFNKQKRVIKQRLENHPIISWVYEAINPHPFHKKLHITNTDRGTNFIGQTQLENKIDLYLDQIFSAAQLNILALSIFLGLGLTQNYSELEQLFLDDPIQSMDDVNILAFIDVLRAIMDSSRYQHKRLIISTHDDNFAQLLSIKMRNKKTVQYHIVGYTEEGPIIKQM